MSEVGPVSSVPSPTTPEICAVCEMPFTAAEWEDRHDSEDGPVHPGCCQECRS